MTSQEPPPMSPTLRALVDADNQRPGAPASDRARVYAALGVSLGLVPAAAVVGAHAASAAAASQSATAAASGGTSTIATALGAASTAGRFALLVKAPLVSVGVGVMLGAALTAYVVKGPAARSKARGGARLAVATSVLPAPRPATAPEERPQRPDVPAGLGSSVEAPPRHAAGKPTRVTPDEASRARTSDDGTRRELARAASGGALAAEQSLLDPARAALVRGDGVSALARLDLHARRFPNGALCQERDAMTIRALVLTGDRDGARARAATFRARYPDSLLWPMVDATLRSHP